MKLPQLLRRLRPAVWSGWPEKAYQRQGYQRRLRVVQEHLAECLDVAPPGAVKVLSMCAGDGRDVIGVVQSHPRRNDVSAWLVELNRQSVDLGLHYTTHAGLEKSLRFVNEDATVYTTYKYIAPADIVLVCGVWGHVPPPERGGLVQAAAALTRAGGSVIWTRGVSKGMSRFDEIDSLFAEPAWEKVRVSFTADKSWAVATHRYRGPAQELPADGQIFHFQKNAG
jgi:hypothetical protein